MNVTGMPAYSREVGAMRNPANNADTMKRLIFIYPFGIDQSLANVPFQTAVKGDMDTIGDALRAFFSISVLKEIFTSNALNLVTLASTYQRIERQTTRSSVLINSLMRGGSTRDQSNPLNSSMIDDPAKSTYDMPQLDSAVLQQKVNEKFKRIKDSLRSDPRLKKMLPFMEVITLGNLLDVPVITGTAQFQLDTGALFTLLAAAVSQRRRISTWTEVRTLTNVLKRMPDQSVYDIFTILSNVENNPSLPNTVLGSSLITPPTGLGQQLQMLNNEFNREQNPDKKLKLKAAIDAAQQEYAMHNIAILKDTKMKELERAFLFMTDPQQLMLRYGLSDATAQASYAATKVNAQTELLFDRTKQQMLDFFGGADALFSSVYMLLSPMVQTDSSFIDKNNKSHEFHRWNHTYLSMKQDMVNSFADGFDGFMDTFKRYFDTKIREDIESTSIKIADMNRSCDGAREDFIALMNFFNDTLSSSQIYPTFGYNDVSKFSDSLDKIVTKFSAVKKSTYDALSKFFGGDNMRKIDNVMNNLFSNTFDSFFTKFNATSDPTSPLQARIFALDSPDQIVTYYDGSNEDRKNNPSHYDVNGNSYPIFHSMAAARRKNMHYQVLSQVADVAKLVAQTVFLLVFRVNLCEYVQVADVEFSAAKADVLDLPNYCLVIPLEILQALMVLYTKRNLTQAVLTSGAGFNPLNSSYIKGLVKTFRIQLGIPNLMVLDRKKNELYYSFKYLGNVAEKLKMQAVETFVKHHIQDNSSGMSQLYY